MSLSARAIAISGLGFGAAFTAVNGLKEQIQLFISTGGGKLKPRKKTQPRPAWLKPVVWALEDEEIIQPDIVVADVALLARKRRQREEQELLLLRAI